MNLEHTVTYSRTKNLGDYNSEKVELAISFDSDSLDASIILLQANDMLQVMKAEVFEQLDIAYEIDPETGVVTEAKPEPKAYVPGPPAPAGADEFDQITEGGSGPKGVDSDPPFPADTQDKEQKAVNKSWAVARFSTHPDEFFDNRPNKESGKYQKTAPDLKHKRTKMPVWL